MNRNISTKTINCKGNFRVDIAALYEHLPITPFTPILKKRGRRSKNYIQPVVQELYDGNIITLKYKELYRGVLIKTRKKSKENAFGNSLIIVMMIDNKLINVKMCCNGRFQLTGAKSIEHVIGFVHWLRHYALSLLFVNGPTFQITCNTMLTNVNFSINYQVDRIKLRDYIHHHTTFHSHFEPWSDYTGVTIQMPPTDVEHIPVNILTFHPDGTIQNDTQSFQDYIDSLPQGEKEKERCKFHPVKFFVFQSGKVLLTGTHEHCMYPAYEHFLKIMEEAKDIVKEQLSV